MASPTRPKTFTCFPDLPTEIQLKIWKLCIPPPRVVKLGYRGTGKELKCTSRARIPKLLHVCAMTRELAKKHYKLSFGLLGFSEGMHMSSEPKGPNSSSWYVKGKIWFDFQRDVLFIDTEGYRPCDGLRGISPEVMREEGIRFHELAETVQDLKRVQKLACWEYMPHLAALWSGSELGRVPWAVFTGLKEDVYGIRIASQICDRQLRLVEHPLMPTWELGNNNKLLTGLNWTRRDLFPLPLDPVLGL